MGTTEGHWVIERRDDGWFHADCVICNFWATAAEMIELRAYMDEHDRRQKHGEQLTLI